MALERVTPSDLADLQAFLHEADLTLSGLQEPTVRLWIERDEDGAVVGTTGFELSDDRAHALVRSVAVAPGRRAVGHGSRLVWFALDHASAAGATTAWLFTRRSGPFWQRLGFEPADRDALATALSRTHQVRLFRETGQLDREVAWTRRLG